MRGLRELEVNIDLWVHRMEVAVMDGLEAGAQIAQDQAQSRHRYDNDTMATETSTIGFVVGPGRDGADMGALALAQAESLNPGSGESHTIAIQDAETRPRIILTVFTNYARFLEYRFTGRYAFLGPAMRRTQLRIRNVIAREMRKAGRMRIK